MAIVRMKLTGPKGYLKLGFAAGSAPDERTLKGQIDNEIQPGVKVKSGTGNRYTYYIYVDSVTLVPTFPAVQVAHITPVNDLAANVLNKFQTQ